MEDNNYYQGQTIDGSIVYGRLFQDLSTGKKYVIFTENEKLNKVEVINIEKINTMEKSLKELENNKNYLSTKDALEALGLTDENGNWISAERPSSKRK